jgi:hypothetical protein
MWYLKFLEFWWEFLHLWPQTIEHQHTMTCDIENQCPGFGQTQKCGWVISVNGVIVHLREYKLFILELSPFDLVSWSYCLCKIDKVRFMVFNATFNNISVISWWSVLLVEETGKPRENHRPAANHGKLYHIMLYRIRLPMNGVRTRRHWLHR